MDLDEVRQGSMRPSRAWLGMVLVIVLLVAAVGSVVHSLITKQTPTPCIDVAAVATLDPGGRLGVGWGSAGRLESAARESGREIADRQENGLEEVARRSTFVSSC